MGNVSELFQKHPWAIFAAIFVVALLAYLSSRNSTSGVSDTTFTGGGVIAPPMDPNEAAIEQARISAGQANIGTLAALVLGSEQTNAELTASVTGTNASQEVADRQTNASQEVTDAQTAAGVTVAGINANSQITAARITANAQSALETIQANAADKAAAQQAQLQEATLANQKAIARAADNTSLVGDVIKVGATIAAFFL